MTNSLFLSLNRLPSPPHPPCSLSGTSWRNKLSGSCFYQRLPCSAPLPLTSKYPLAIGLSPFLNQHLFLSVSLSLFQLQHSPWHSGMFQYLLPTHLSHYPFSLCSQQICKSCFAPCLASFCTLCTQLPALSLPLRWLCQGHWWPPCCSI